MNKIDIPAVIGGQKLRDYFMEHVAPSAEYGNGFYVVHKPLHAFKICNNRYPSYDNRRKRRLVNLVIPIGAHVYGNDSYAFADPVIGNDIAGVRKMRASKAFVHSIVQINTTPLRIFSLLRNNARSPVDFDSGYVGDLIAEMFIEDDKLKQANVAYADYNACFLYRAGQQATPRLPFSPQASQCESGIHFFLNLRDALLYY